jgi:biopolymer transport protein ExbD
MALSLGGSSGYGGGRRRFGRGSAVLSEMNIVPLVDVVLVLLIIFMLTAHVMEFGMEINVPQVKEVRDSADDLPVINITRDGKLFLNEKPVNNVHLLSAQIVKQFKNPKAVYVRPDANTIYDPIAQVISILGEAKIPIRLVAKPVDSSGRRP